MLLFLVIPSKSLLITFYKCEDWGRLALYVQCPRMPPGGAWSPTCSNPLGVPESDWFPSAPGPLLCQNWAWLICILISETSMHGQSGKTVQAHRWQLHLVVILSPLWKTINLLQLVLDLILKFDLLKMLWAPFSGLPKPVLFLSAFASPCPSFPGTTWKSGPFFFFFPVLLLHFPWKDIWHFLKIKANFQKHTGTKGLYLSRSLRCRPGAWDFRSADILLSVGKHAQLWVFQIQQGPERGHSCHSSFRARMLSVGSTSQPFWMQILLCHLLTVWHWASYVTAPWPIFSIYKIVYLW